MGEMFRKEERVSLSAEDKLSILVFAGPPENVARRQGCNYPEEQRDNVPISVES